MSRFTITTGEYENQIIRDFQELTNESKESKAVNKLIKRGLAKYDGGTEDDMIRLAIREQIGFSIKPFTESLASLSSKVSLMSGRTVYLLLEIMISGLGNSKDLIEKIKGINEEAKSLADSNMKSNR